jgi:hypothetical protein
MKSKGMATDTVTLGWGLQHRFVRYPSLIRSSFWQEQYENENL